MPASVYPLPDHPAFDEHYWADWVELLCLGDLDREINVGKVRLEAKRRKDDLGEAQEIGENEEPSLDDEAPAAKHDKWHTRVERWFGHLKHRSDHFGATYPFELDLTKSSLKLKENLNDGHRLYLLLLLASNLRYFSKQQSDLTAVFEVVCLEVFRQWFPANAEVHLFGANKMNKGQFAGKLWDKIRDLAKRLNETVLVKEADFAPTDMGDNGLDLVGWIPTGDSVPGRFLVFGQCACTPEWVKKQDSSGGDAWSSVMTLCSYPLNVIFIPFCLRTSDGSWHKPQDQRRNVLVDRSRIMFFLSGRLPALSGMKAFAVVDTLLASPQNN